MCQMQILVSPFPNPAWAFVELACSLDKFDVELGGWERAEQVRWVLHGFELFAKEYVLLWLPCRSHCQRSGDLPFHQQMPSCIRERFALSSLSATILLKWVLIQFRICWVQAIYSKNSFPGSANESKPGRDWPHVYILLSKYLATFSFRNFTFQTGEETLVINFP